MKNSCLIIAGEKSGEDHAMTFFPKLKSLLPDCQFFGVGGNELEGQGVELIYHLKDFSSMGVTEVLGKLPFYFKAMDRLVEEVQRRQCKVAILVDFQGFNLKIAKKLKALGVKVLYYVAPQAWVWKPHRAQVLEQNVHTLFTILPFEKKWFMDRGVSKVKAVVHPLMVKYAAECTNIPTRNFIQMQNRKKKILLLPGSRNSEVKALLPIFMQVIQQLKQQGIELEISLVTVASVSQDNYVAYLNQIDKIYQAEQLHLASHASDLCLAASGTVTLATGIFELPTIVAYKFSWLNEILLKLVIPYKGPASLTNIILDQYVFPEFLQRQANAENLTAAALRFLSDEGYYNTAVEKLAKTKTLLQGDDFDVAEYMAQVISH